MKEGILPDVFTIADLVTIQSLKDADDTSRQEVLRKLDEVETFGEVSLQCVVSDLKAKVSSLNDWEFDFLTARKLVEGVDY